jgi:CHRD domain/Bacterial Ig domain
MSTALRIRQALPPALLWAATVLLAACGGGGGMGSATTSMGASVTSPGSMNGGSMDMSCMGMGGMMSCPAPTIALMAPAGTVSRTVMLRAHVTVMDGDVVSRVDFMVDGTRIGSANGQPFNVSWDSTAVSDGPHALTATVSDSLGQSSSASPVAIQVDNHPAFTVTLSPAQVIPTPVSAASGSAHLSANLASGALTGSIVLTGVTAIAVTLNAAFAGDRGAVLLGLKPGASPSEWDVPAGALLTEEQTTALLEGGLYVIASSSANPVGELRGQITPANIEVIFSAMSGTQEVPPVTINAAGSAATTVDSVAGTVTVHVHATGLDDAMAGEVAEGARCASGARLAALTKDDLDPGHWSAQLVAVSAADMAAFEASHWYINLLAPADPQGAIRGQIEPGAH